MKKPTYTFFNTKPLKMEVINSDYQRLYDNGTQLDEESPPTLSNYRNNNYYYRNNNSDSFFNRSWISLRWAWLIVVLGTVIAITAVVIIKRYVPLLMKKEIIPAVNWLIYTCSSPVLAAILFGAIALFPILLLPTMPVQWIVGMTFGYGIGFLLTMAGGAVAVSLPYFIACHLFLHKIEKWLDNYPDKAAIVRLAGDGDWLHQFQAIALLRLTPFPYVVLNYTAVVMGVKYIPYLAGSVIGSVPEILLALYSGRLLRTVAEAMKEHTHVSKFEIICDGVGFGVAAISTIAVGFYSKRRLKQLQEVEEQQQQLL